MRKNAGGKAFGAFVIFMILAFLFVPNLFVLMLYYFLAILNLIVAFFTLKASFLVYFGVFIIATVWQLNRLTSNNRK